MTDITAQTFREASDAIRVMGDQWARLLLAAAEQREQLDAMIEAERIATSDEPWTDDDQAAVDMLRAKMAKVVADFNAVKAQEQIATLTAENERLKADLHQTNEYYYAATDEATNLTHERDEARATLAKVREHCAYRAENSGVMRDLLVILGPPTRPA